MRLLLILVSLTFLFCAIASAQTPANATLSANRVKAQFNANGALFTNFQKGQFIAPYAPGQPEISLLRASGLWLAGLDPAGNLKGAAQLYNADGKADFKPGVLDENGLPQPGGDRVTGIYRVTAAEIAAHEADFADNGVIDNPQPSVFGWPAQGNWYFSQYHNGEELPFNTRNLAGYNDNNLDGSYDPSRGDYPSVEVRGCARNIVPAEMLWFSSHDAGFPHTQSGMNDIRMEVQCQAFAFNCTEDTPLHDAVFICYKLIYLGTERLDSAYIGLFNDFDIGNPADDFFGCDPSRALVFGYNGDNLDEGGYGADIPALGVKMLRGPLNTFGEEILMKHVIGFNATALSQPVEYYRLLSGSQIDGTPVPNGGIQYPGNPNDPATDSEVSAGNTPGQRYVLTSYGPFTLLPGAVNEFIAAYFYTQQPGATPLQNVQAMYTRADVIGTFFENCFKSSDQIVCNPIVDAPVLPAPAAGLKIYPNPAAQNFSIESEKTGIKRVQLTDLTGRVTFNQHLIGATVQLNVPVAALPNGMYLAEIWLDNGALAWEKVIVSR